jgi:hypothetical protein
LAGAWSRRAGCSSYGSDGHACPCPRCPQKPAKTRPSLNRPPVLPITAAPAVAASNGQQSATNRQAEHLCAEPSCGRQFTPNRHGPPKRFCSARCRNRYQGAAYRRRVFDAEAVIHPGEVQRPFDTYLGDEPSWVTAELAPPALGCECAG